MESAYPLFETESWKRCRWESKEAQYTRFKVLCEIGNLDYKSVLDVGCGDGELLRYLRIYHPLTAYHGIDESLEAVEIASTLHGDESKFSHSYIEHVETRGFDYILLSGVFNYDDGDNEKEVCHAIDKLFPLCNIGLGINFLDDRYPYRHKDFYMFNMDNMYELVLSMGMLPYNIGLRSEYMKYTGPDETFKDFTMYLYK